MDKELLIQMVTKELLRRAEASSRSAKSARKASIEAPSKMESRYDSAKSEQDWLSHAFALAGAETRQDIEKIQTVDLRPSGTVRDGSVVTTETSDGNTERYFLLPGGAGVILQEESIQKDIAVIDPRSPIGSALMRKVAGDRCEIEAPGGVYSLTVVSVE